MGHYYMEDCLLHSQRVSGTRRPITIVNPSYYEAFFVRLGACDRIELELRAFVALTLSGGLRVNEALALRPVDAQLEKSTFRVRRVLKKNKTIQGTHGPLDVNIVPRDCVFHPVALTLLKELLNQGGIKHFQRIFNMHRSHIDVRLKELFGPAFCAHSLRHSHVSWLLHSKNQSEMAVSRMMEMSVQVVSSYNHIDRIERLGKLYKGS